MKNNNTRLNKIILAVSLLITLLSCNKSDLNPIPQTFVSDVSAFSTPERIQAQLLSVYSGFKSGSFYGGRFIINGDTKADNFINETNNNVTDYDIWLGNPTNTSNSVVNIWAQAYFTINSANVFLEGIGITTVIPDSLIKVYSAEARFIRAVTYLGLLQFYAKPFVVNNGAELGVPLRLTAIKGPGQSALIRSTVSDVYKQIILDLDYAELNLLSTNGTDLNNTTRAHKNSAIAIKTRVYLNMQNYDKVIEEGNKIASQTQAPFQALTGVGAKLEPNINVVFNAPYTSLESIFSTPNSVTDGDNPGIQNQLAYYYSPDVGNGEYSLNPTAIVGDTINWRNSDARRTNFVISNSGKSWLDKYKVGSPYTDYVPVIRYSEVLLNLAEAIVKKSNTVDSRAINLLNAVRKRSDPTFTYPIPSTSVVLLNQILLERNIEFLGEGLRNNDLTRNLLTIPAKGTVAQITPTTFGYIWPISNTELLLNTLCVDNN